MSGASYVVSACATAQTPTTHPALRLRGSRRTRFASCTPSKLIDAAKRQEVELFSSTPLLAELYGVMARAKFAQALAARGLQFQTLFEGYAALVQLVTPAHIKPTITRDPADDAMLACALAVPADLIVSGDAHLLDLKQYQDMPIVTAAQAVQAITTPLI